MCDHGNTPEQRCHGTFSMMYGSEEVAAVNQFGLRGEDQLREHQWRVLLEYLEGRVLQGIGRCRPDHIVYYSPSAVAPRNSKMKAKSLRRCTLSQCWSCWGSGVDQMRGTSLRIEAKTSYMQCCTFERP